MMSIVLLLGAWEEISDLPLVYLSRGCKVHLLHRWNGFVLYGFSLHFHKNILAMLYVVTGYEESPGHQGRCSGLLLLKDPVLCFHMLDDDMSSSLSY